MSTLKEIQKVISETGKKNEIEQLNFSGIKIERFTPQIKKAIEECDQLQILVLAQCELVSLDNLPNVNLKAVDFSANKLNDDEFVKLAIYKDLHQLIFVENQVSKLQTLKFLSGFQNLQDIDLSDNPVSNEQNYRDWIFENLKQVQIVDRKDKQGNEIVDEEQFEDDENDDEGEFDDDQDEQQFDQDSQESEQKPKKKK